MNDRDAGQRRIAAAAALLAAARDRLDAGAFADLTGLVEAIEESCTAIARLPGEQSRALKPLLVGLLDDLGRLEEQVKRQHDALAGEIDSLLRRQQAQTAYGRRTEGL